MATSLTYSIAAKLSGGNYREHIVDVTMQAASGLLGILPAIAFFLIFQRTLTRGITVGAVK